MGSMRELFPGHFRPSAADFAKLWKECVFSFDANVLLNLYRYTDDSRRQFQEVLKKLKDLAWLTHQAAYEFHVNRAEVVVGRTRVYDQVEAAINEAISAIENEFQRQASFHDTAVSSETTSALREIVKSIQVKKSKEPDYRDADQILDFVAEYFDNRVGSPYEPAEHATKCKEAATRFEQRIPPGFKDDNEKRKPGDKKYGDALIWFQLLDHAKEQEKPLILVTDEKKEDWWYRVSGQTIGPLPELIAEFFRVTGQGFYMYNSPAFIELASKHFEVNITPKAIEEIKAVSRERAEGKDVLYKLIMILARYSDAVGRLSERERINVVELTNRALGYVEDGNWTDADVLRFRQLIDSCRNPPERPVPLRTLRKFRYNLQRLNQALVHREAYPKDFPRVEIVPYYGE